MKYVVVTEHTIDSYTVAPFTQSTDIVGEPELIIQKTLHRSVSVFTDKEIAVNFSYTNAGNLIDMYEVADDHFKDIKIDIFMKE